MKANLNPVLFVIGFGAMSYGLWMYRPHVAYIVGGSILMVGVAVDVAVRLFARERQK